MKIKKRLDVLLTERMYADTRSKAQAIIMAGSVYVNGQGKHDAEGLVKGKKLTVYPMFAEPYIVEIPEGEGGHGGGDPVLLQDIFGIPEPEKLLFIGAYESGEVFRSGCLYQRGIIGIFLGIILHWA